MQYICIYHYYQYLLPTAEILRWRDFEVITGRSWSLVRTSLPIMANMRVVPCSFVHYFQTCTCSSPTQFCWTASLLFIYCHHRWGCERNLPLTPRQWWTWMHVKVMHVIKWTGWTLSILYVMKTRAVYMHISLLSIPLTMFNYMFDKVTQYEKLIY